MKRRLLKINVHVVSLRNNGRWRQLTWDIGMDLHAIFRHGPRDEMLPEFIRELRDIRGVRVIRMHGPVGRAIGTQVDAVDKAAASSGAFSRPLLLDFKDTTECDFVTVAYMVRALR